jgi:hypothetical protein
MSETTLELPKYLFRGDADKANQRLLKSTFRSRQLQTNLISGGYGRQIFEEPLVEFVNRHVGIGWNQSHFLSFSESRLTAIRYGLHLGVDIDPNVEDDIYDDEESWDFVFFTLDVGQMAILKLGDGVFEGRYLPTLTKFQNYSFVSIVLIDVHTVLKNDPRAIVSETLSITR